MPAELIIWDSVRRQSSVSQLSQNLLGRFLSNFSCCLPWAMPRKFFSLKKNAFSKFSRCFLFIFVNMERYGSKKFKTLLLPQIAFDFFFSKFSWIFFSLVLTKVLFRFFTFWVHNFSRIFKLMKSKFVCRPSSVSELSQNLSCRFISNLSCCFPCSHMPWRYFWICEKKIHFQFFRIFFSFSLALDSMGAKRYSSSNHFWIFSNFFWILVLTKVLYWIFQISNLRFFTNVIPFI